MRKINGIFAACFMVFVIGTVCALRVDARSSEKSVVKSSEKSINKVHGKNFSGALRDQMVQLLVSMSDLDIVMNRDHETDYTLFKEDADRILAAVSRIRVLDETQVFAPYLNELEGFTTQFRDASVARNPKARTYPEKMFNVCYQCHATHRDQNFNVK